MLVEQLAIQQQIEQLQQQQHHIAGIHQQYVNMGMLPPQQQQVPNVNFPQQSGIQPANISQQNAFQFPQQVQSQQLNAPLNPQLQAGNHRRNQSAFPNVNMGPPPAPSSGTAFGDFNQQGMSRDNASQRGGRGGGPPAGQGHNRRHSLALPEARKNAEIAQQAQQKKSTSGFQFPIPGASGASPTTADRTLSPTSADEATGW